MDTEDASNRLPGAIDQRVAGQIKKIRKGRRISQTELASSVGVSFQQLQKYERGVNRITVSRLVAIADALDVPISELVQSANRSRLDVDEVEGLTCFLADPVAKRLLRVWPALSPGARSQLVLLLESLSPTPISEGA